MTKDQAIAAGKALNTVYFKELNSYYGMPISPESDSAMKECCAAYIAQMNALWESLSSSIQQSFTGHRHGNRRAFESACLSK